MVFPTLCSSEVREHAQYIMIIESEVERCSREEGVEKRG